jgi:hypothetical protein
MDAVEAALTDLMESSPVWNAGQYANHAPMVVETLGHLERDDAIDGWLRPRRPRYDDAPPGIGPIGTAWTDALGVFDRYRDWRAFFSAAIDSDPWQDVVGLWTARLAPGFAGHLFHGVIRVAHAVRGLSTHDNDTRRHELANALAYWAAVYDELPGEPPPPVCDDLALLHAATENYLADGSAYPIYAVHGVTGALTVRRLRPVVGDAVADRLRCYAAQACDWVTQMAAARPEGASADAVEPGPLVTASVTNGDEHAIKLADACVEAFAATADPIYLEAGADGIVRFAGA